MRISFIGTGNVAHHLMQAIHSAGHTIVEVYSRNFENARHYASQYNAKPIQNLFEIADGTDLIIIAASDDSIQEIGRSLAKHKIPVVHTSGSIHLNALQSEDHAYGVIYPLQTFSKSKELDFQKVPVYIEASDNVLLNLLNQLANSITSTVLNANSEQRISLHIAAVFACNFSNYMYSIASEILKNAELDFQHLLPLIQETASKIQYLNPREAQTGPAKRGDTEVIQKHLITLEQFPEFQKVYRLISEEISKKYNH